MHERDVARMYADHAQEVFSFLAYRTGDRALAEDLLADTFERVLTARRGHDPRRGSAKTWLLAIAANLLTDHLRRQAAEQRALERAPVPAASRGPDAADPRLGLIDDRDELAAGLASLPAEEREALALRFGADLAMREIADVVGEPLTTVDGRVRRGLRHLREALDTSSTAPGLDVPSAR
jgi:RNA polymerase sigma-70 factor (ECF subfamily)